MIAKTVARTLFYQFFLIFVGLSVGFILNAEWVGIKSLIIQRSVNNIFFPIEYDEHMERWVKGWGAFKVYMDKNQPQEFEIIDEHVYANEEYYWCRFKYKDKKGTIKIDEGVSRVRWKTWEYYYESEEILDTPEKVRESIEKGKEQTEKRKLEIEKAKEREKELLKQNQIDPANVTKL